MILRERENLSYLCAEKAFAGPGIRKMFEFFNRDRDLTEEEKNEKKFTNELILQKGIKNEDPSCRKVLEFFLEMYASEVGNMALRDKSSSGIYLVGMIFSLKFNLFDFLRFSNQCSQGLFASKQRKIFGILFFKI